jgi:hypothetical protein
MKKQQEVNGRIAKNRGTEGKIVRSSAHHFHCAKDDYRREQER